MPKKYKATITRRKYTKVFRGKTIKRRNAKPKKKASTKKNAKPKKKASTKKHYVGGRSWWRRSNTKEKPVRWDPDRVVRENRERQREIDMESARGERMREEAREQDMINDYHRAREREREEREKEIREREETQSNKEEEEVGEEGEIEEGIEDRRE
jgi:hypothetical protein